MPEELLQRLQQYARSHHLRLGARLGSGIHGLVHVALRVQGMNESAVKTHYEHHSFAMERAVYLRLKQAEIHNVLGLNVPQLLACDDDLQVIEMSIVRKPFLLDFAGATLDRRAEFSQELWREWEESKREQFGAQWRSVQHILSELERLGIYLTDVSPSNIALD